MPVQPYYKINIAALVLASPRVYHIYLLFLLFSIVFSLALEPLPGKSGEDQGTNMLCTSISHWQAL
jgi:hypothetical protein